MYPNLRGRPFNISPFEYDVSCRLAILTFFLLRYLPLIPNFFSVFIMKNFMLYQMSFLYQFRLSYFNILFC